MESKNICIVQVYPDLTELWLGERAQFVVQSVATGMHTVCKTSAVVKNKNNPSRQEIGKHEHSVRLNECKKN